MAAEVKKSSAAGGSAQADLDASAGDPYGSRLRYLQMPEKPLLRKTYTVTGDAAMTMVADRVVKIVAEQFEVEPFEIALDTPIALDLGVDSLDQQRLVIELEKAFNVHFPAGAAERCRTIGEVVILIERSRTT